MIRVKRKKSLYFTLIMGIICCSFLFNLGEYHSENNFITSDTKINEKNKIKSSKIHKIHINLPKQDDVWNIGDTEQIEWTCTINDNSTSNHVNIMLYKGDIFIKLIASNVKSQDYDNVYSWKVSKLDEGTNYVIALQDTKTNKLYYSSYFTIRIKKVISIPSYEKKEYMAGESMKINWTTTGSINKVDILIYDELNNQQIIISNLTNDEGYTWKIPWWYLQGTYYIRIRDSDENKIYKNGPLFTIKTSIIVVILIVCLIGLLIACTTYIASYMIIRNQTTIKLDKIEENTIVEKSNNILIVNTNLGYHLKFSPDGHFLIGSRKNCLRIWDYIGGKIVGAYSPKGSRYALSPDNNRIITNRGEVIELNSLQKKEVLHLKGFSSISSMDFSPDGKNIITSSSKKKGLKIRDSRNGNIITSISTEFPVSHIAFSHDGKNLIGFYGTKAFIWEYSSELLIQSLELNMIPRAYALSLDGNRLFTGGYAKEIKEWDLATGKLVYTYKGHSNTILSMVITPDNRYLISSSSDNTIKIWDILYKSLITTLNDGEKSPISSLALHPEGKDLISSSSSNQFIIWKYKDYIRSEIERRNVIKSKIMAMSSHNERLQINEIAEECEEEEALCRSLLIEMIEEKEIQATYFESSESVLFPVKGGENDTNIEETLDTSSVIRKSANVEGILSITREFEFIGGQVRFKIGLKNRSNYTLTDFKISFEIPDALKWIVHEPGYQRSGDTILIPKIGAGEKKAVSLYLEPINCMVSSINAFISFHDEKDQPQAFTMTPEIISISCPLFFTEEEANLARVKHLQKSLPCHDKKVFPIVNSEKTDVLFNSTFLVLKRHDIKLISKDYIEIEQFGELWFYGKTKYKQNVIITNIIVDGKNKILEIDVYGDNEGQIIAFLAEVGGSIRQDLIHHGIIKPDDRFYDIRASILASVCPYCMSIIPAKLVEQYRNKKSITCNVCNIHLT